MSDPSRFPAAPLGPRSRPANRAPGGYHGHRFGGAQAGGTPPAGTASSAADSSIGVIDGPVVVRSEHHRFRGHQALLISGALAIAVSIVRTILGGAEFARALVLPIVVLAGLLLVYRVMLGPVVGRLLRWALRLLTSLTAAMTRITSWAAVSAGSHAVAVVRAGRGARIGQAEHPVTVRRFRVRCMTGETRAVTMSGDLRVGELSGGDVIRIRGRRRSDGSVHPRSVDVLAASGGPVLRVVTARPPATYLAMRWGSWRGYALAVLLVAWMVSATGLVP